MFNIATAPFAHNRKQTRTLMLLVILACVPGLLAQTWFFGWGSFIQIQLALVTALLCEALVLKLRGRAIKPALMDGSAALTAVLIGLSLPPLLPWWMLVVGTAFAIIVAKHLYGGLGQNLFNPAMVAYVLLLVSFPVQMTSWLPPESVRAYSLGFGDAALWCVRQLRLLLDVGHRRKPVREHLGEMVHFARHRMFQAHAREGR
jgi:electron transport complex protein RnfD